MVGSNDMDGGDFTSNPDNKKAAEKQINEGMQGIKGRLAGVEGANLAHEAHIEKKKREDKLGYVSMSLALEQAYQVIEEEIATIRENTQEAGASFESMSTATVDVVSDLAKKNIELNDKLIQLREELSAMKAAGATEEALAEKKAEIEHTAKGVELLTGIIVSTTKQYGDAKTAIEEANETIAQLEQQKEIAKNSSDPEAALKDIQTQIDAAKAKLEDAEQLIAKADAQREVAEEIIKEQFSEQLVLNVPKHHLDEYDKANNDALAAVEAAALNGGTLSASDYEKIAATPGMSEEKLKDLMAQNKVELEGAKPTPTNAIRNALAHEPDSNGIRYAHVPSFADSEQFAATNDPSAPTASYNDPVNSHTAEAPSLTMDEFGSNPLVAAKKAAALEEEERRIALELAQSNKLNGPMPQGDGSGQMG